MRIYPATGAIMLTGLALIFTLISCSPKCVVSGRVVDAETRQPIRDAAVAIRWYTDYPDKQSAKTDTIAAVQSLTNDQGVFKIPRYPDKKYILGVYKNGYICWSSRDVFTTGSAPSGTEKNRKRQDPRITEGMEIGLEPFQKGYSRDLHAGFTVMVAGESTDSDSGVFHQAIQTEYRLWRENLRKEFQKQVGAK